MACYWFGWKRFNFLYGHQLVKAVTLREKYIGASNMIAFEAGLLFVDLSIFGITTGATLPILAEYFYGEPGQSAAPLLGLTAGAAIAVCVPFTSIPLAIGLTSRRFLTGRGVYILSHYRILPRP